MGAYSEYVANEILQISVLSCPGLKNFMTIDSITTESINFLGVSTM